MKTKSRKAAEIIHAIVTGSLCFGVILQNENWLFFAAAFLMSKEVGKSIIDLATP